MRADVIAVLGVVVALVGAFVAAYFFGGRRWRDNTDAEREAHRQTKEKLAARDATIVEKDVALEERDRQIAGMSSRLARLDEERKEFGGSKVYEALLAQHRDLVSALQRLEETAAIHEERAATRASTNNKLAAERQEEFLTRLGDQNRQILGLIETVGAELNKCFNGKEK